MQTKSTFRPRIEVLEDRCLPALTLVFNAANQLVGISGPPDGNVALTLLDTNVLNVNDNGNDLGTFPTGNSLNVAVGASAGANPALRLNLNGFAFIGNLALSTGNQPEGYDTVIDNGLIAGSLAVTTGNGPDTLTIGQLTQVIVNGPVTIGMGAGNDVLMVAGSVLEGAVSIKGVNNFDLMNALIGADLTFNSSAEPVSTNFATSAGSIVQGDVLIKTGNRQDNVNLGGAILGDADVRMKDGNDQFTLNTTATIQGLLLLKLNGGADQASVDGAIVGDVRVNLGEGNDAITFNGANVQGIGIIIFASHGNDVFNVGAAGLNAPATSLVFVGCSGNQVVNWDAALPTLLSAYLDGGVGDNQFTAAGAIPFPITLRGFN